MVTGALKAASDLLGEGARRFTTKESSFFARCEPVVLQGARVLHYVTILILDRTWEGNAI